MQFIVIGRDGTDNGALDRRMGAREAHLAMAREMHGAGKWLYAAAMLNEKEQMCGSMIVCEFESRQALEKEWLDREPYIREKVWERIEISRAATAPFWTR